MDSIITFCIGMVVGGLIMTMVADKSCKDMLVLNNLAEYNITTGEFQYGTEFKEIK